MYGFIHCNIPPVKSPVRLMDVNSQSELTFSMEHTVHKLLVPLNNLNTTIYIYIQIQYQYVYSIYIYVYRSTIIVFLPYTVDETNISFQSTRSDPPQWLHCPGTNRSFYTPTCRRLKREQFRVVGRFCLPMSMACGVNSVYDTIIRIRNLTLIMKSTEIYKELLKHLETSLSSSNWLQNLQRITTGLGTAIVPRYTHISLGQMF